MKQRFFSTVIVEYSNKLLIKACQRPVPIIFGLAAAAAIHGTYDFLRESQQEDKNLTVKK